MLKNKEKREKEERGENEQTKDDSDSWMLDLRLEKILGLQKVSVFCGPCKILANEKLYEQWNFVIVLLVPRVSEIDGASHGDSRNRSSGDGQMLLMMILLGVVTVISHSCSSN